MIRVLWARDFTWRFFLSNACSIRACSYNGFWCEISRGFHIKIRLHSAFHSIRRLDMSLLCRGFRIRQPRHGSAPLLIHVKTAANSTATFKKPARKGTFFGRGFHAIFPRGKTAISLTELLSLKSSNAAHAPQYRSVLPPLPYARAFRVIQRVAMLANTCINYTHIMG